MHSDSRYKYLLKNVGILTISNFSSRILVFFMVPLYTSVLTTAEYGTYDLSISTVQLLYPILTINIVDAVMRFSMDRNYRQKEVASVGLSYIVRSVIVATIIMAAIGALKLIPDIEGFELLILLYYIFYVFNQYFIQLAKGLEKVNLMAIGGVIGTVIMLFCNLLFLLVFRLGLKGFYLANILSQALPVFFYFFSLRYWTRIDMTSDGKRLRKEMTTYSAPLIFTTLGWWANHTIDKYMVTFLCGLAANGILSVAYKIPQILNVIQSIFTQAWQISAVKEYGNEDTPQFYGQSFTYVNIGICICCSFLMLANRTLSRLLYAKDFFIAWKYVPFLLISTVLNTSSGFLGPLLAAKKDSNSMARSAIWGTCLNVVLNFFLVYFMGIQGAVVATAISSYVIYYVRLRAVNGMIEFEHYWKIFFSWILLCIQAVIAILAKSSLIQIPVFIFLLVIYARELYIMIRKGWGLIVEH